MIDIAERLDRWRIDQAEFMFDEESGMLSLAAEEIKRLRALLREALDRETRYVLPLYRDINYAARVRRALGIDPNEHYKIEDTGS